MQSYRKFSLLYSYEIHRTINIVPKNFDVHKSRQRKLQTKVIGLNDNLHFILHPEILTFEMGKALVSLGVATSNIMR
jgi:hypothetical protein